MSPTAFIPAWLNNAGLSQAEFRVYCCLAARADRKSAIAWPKAETIANDCLMARNTVWKSLKGLEQKGMILKKGKKFADSNRYQILTPTGANGEPKEVDPIGASEIPIGESPNRSESDTSISANGEPKEVDPIGASEIPIGESPNRSESDTSISVNGEPKEVDPIGANEIPPFGANEILPLAQMDSLEGTPKKVHQRKNTIRENSPEEVEFSNWFKSTLPAEEQKRMTDGWLSRFCESYEKLIRIDRREPAEIRRVCKWAREDNFWRANFKSPAKLRERDKQGTLWFDVFAGRMSCQSTPTQPSHRQPSAYEADNNLTLP